jgi:hypothetical protein
MTDADSGSCTIRECCALCRHSVDAGHEWVRRCELRKREVSARYWCVDYKPAASDAYRGTEQAAHDGRREADLLADCTAHLRGQSYYAATPDNHAAIGSGRIHVRGTYVHLHGDLRGQPQLPDLVVFAAAADCRALLVELKAEGPRGGQPHYQPGQREMIGGGFWTECRTLDGFKAALAAWERDWE